MSLKRSTFASKEFPKRSTFASKELVSYFAFI